MYRTIRFIVSISVVLSCLLILAGAVAVRADSMTTSFDSLAVGNINGQDGWSMTGAYDVAVVANTYGYASFGTQSLRISDAVTSGSFGDQTFAKPLVNAVGEITATAGSFTIGTRQTHFEMQFDIASTQPLTQQLGMHLSVSPDRGDGSRMSYLRFEDNAAGLDVFFDDVQQPLACTPAGCANFVETQIATGLTRSVPHTIKLTMDTLDGPSNDIVKVYIDGTPVHTGTSWEDYYRYDPEAAPESTPRIVKTVEFRESGAATPADAGKGFLVDNFSTSSSSFTLSTGTTGNGSGTIGLNPPGGRYDSGTVVTVTATANTGSSFAGWSGDLSGMTNPTNITMNGDKIVTATFALNPPAGLSASNDSPTALGSVTTLTATVTDGLNVTYAWNFGDSSFGAGAAVTHTYPAAGTYTAIVTATNSAGSLSALTTVYVTTSPIAHAGADQTVRTGGSVTLDGSASVDPGNFLPLTYHWQQTGGPAVILTGANNVTSTFTSPVVTQPLTLTFGLTVTNSQSLVSLPDMVVITVEPYRCMLPLVVK